MARGIVEEFRSLWNSEYSLTYDEFCDVYRERYNIIKHQREIARSEEIISLEKYKLKPNSMQERFIANLRKILEQGEERALLISATGARFILMTGRKPLKNKDFGPVFSYVHWMPGAGKRGINFLANNDHNGKKICKCRYGVADYDGEVILYI